MLAQFDQALSISTYMWAQNRVQNLAQGYINLSTPLYLTPEVRLTGYYSYSSPFKQWVYDSGVAGAQIINAVSGGGFSEPLTRASGVHFDYLNGRVLVPQALGANLSLTGSYAVAEVNFWVPLETQDYLLTQQKYFVNPRYQGIPTSGIAPYSYVTPAVFVNTINDTSEAFSFGGLDDTTTTMSLTCLCESDYQLKALLSLFRDARYGYLPLIGIAQNPLDGYNDVKGGTGFNYSSVIAQYGTPGNLIYIKQVRTSKVSDRNHLNPGLFAGIIDLDMSYIRQPQ